MHNASVSIIQHGLARNRLPMVSRQAHGTPKLSLCTGRLGLDHFDEAKLCIRA